MLVAKKYGHIGKAICAAAVVSSNAVISLVDFYIRFEIESKLVKV